MLTLERACQLVDALVVTQGRAVHQVDTEVGEATFDDLPLVPFVTKSWISHIWESISGVDGAMDLVAIKQLMQAGKYSELPEPFGPMDRCTGEFVMELSIINQEALMP